MTIIIPSIRILNCPFCGGQASLVIDSSIFGITYMVRCDDCCADVNWFKDLTDAVESWNNRAETKSPGTGQG